MICKAFDSLVLLKPSGIFFVVTLIALVVLVAMRVSLSFQRTKTAMSSNKSWFVHGKGYLARKDIKGSSVARSTAKAGNLN